MNAEVLNRPPQLGDSAEMLLPLLVRSDVLNAIRSVYPTRQDFFKVCVIMCIECFVRCNSIRKLPQGWGILE